MACFYSAKRIVWAMFPKKLQRLKVAGVHKVLAFQVSAKESKASAAGRSYVGGKKKSSNPGFKK